MVGRREPSFVGQEKGEGEFSSGGELFERGHLMGDHRVGHRGGSSTARKTAETRPRRKQRLLEERTCTRCEYAEGALSCARVPSGEGEKTSSTSLTEKVLAGGWLPMRFCALLPRYQRGSFFFPGGRWLV